MEKYPIIGLLYIGLCLYTDFYPPPPPPPQLLDIHRCLLRHSVKSIPP